MAAKQLQFAEEARRKLSHGMDVLAMAVVTTLGPKGPNVALDRKFGSLTITHDGVTVAKEIELEDPFENMGAQLLKEAATKTNDIAGDGTTTSTVLAHSIVTEGMKSLAAGYNPMLLKRGIEAATKAVAEKINEQAIELTTKEEIANVASISAQDRIIGDLIADVMDKVGKDGVITVEESKGLEFEKEYVEGMQFDRGYISPHFITDPEHMEANISEPYILIHDKKISAAADIVPVLEKLVQLGRRELVIIAEDIDGEARDRAKQALVKLALEPEWEARFEPNSYGVRPGRCPQDAIAAIFNHIRLKPKYVLEADIEKVTFTGWARDYIDLHGLKGFRERAHRVLFLTAHLGNWEFASGVFGLMGVEIVPIFRAIRNPFVNRLVRGLRLVAQEKLIERRGAVPVMVEHLDKGGNIGMLFDQEAVHGLAVPFFGLPARTHKTPAILARDHGVKIFSGAVLREGDFLRYEARGELLDLSRQSDDRIRDLEESTTELMRRLEDEIRRRPEQYLWMHRSWKRAGIHDEV